MQLWELREEVQDPAATKAFISQMLQRVDAPNLTSPGGSFVVLGLYSSLALARAALSARLRPLFNGGDCFTAPCHDALDVGQCWKEDGSGKIYIRFKERSEYVPEVLDGDTCKQLTLTVAATYKLDEPPPDSWRFGVKDFLDAVQPPPPPPPAAAPHQDEL